MGKFLKMGLEPFLREILKLLMTNLMEKEVQPMQMG